MDIDAFLNEYAFAGDILGELKRLPYQTKAIEQQPNVRINTRSFEVSIETDFAVVHREQSYNEEATNFVRRFFKDDQLTIRQKDVTTKKDAMELLDFLRRKAFDNQQHNIVVKRWTDIPTEHYQFLYDNSYSIFVLNELDTTPLKERTNNMKHPIIGRHVMRNFFRIEQYLLKPSVKTAGRNQANVQKERDAHEKYKDTYSVYIEVFEQQSRIKGKLATQSDIVNYINENKLLDWEVNQPLISRSMSKTGNKEEYKVLRQKLKEELK